MILKRINKLKNVGIFQDFEWPNPKSFQNLKKYNVIYGWNGTGKSTLTSLLQLLDEKSSLPTRLRDSEFEILFSNDEDELKINNNNTANAPLIRVFNRNFVENHIKWEKNKADSIAYLGEEDASRKEQLENLKTRLQKIQNKHSDKKEDHEAVGNAIKKWKKDNARIIKEVLTTEGRSDKYANYNISDIREQLNNTFKDRNSNYDKLIKSDDDLNKVRDTIHQSQKNELDNVRFQLTGLSEMHNSLLEVLKETVVSSALDELKDKPQIERWIGKGLTLHKKNKTETCEFCGNEITEERLSDLEAHFSDTYESFVNKIKKLKDEINKITFDLDFPQKLEFDKSLQQEFKNELDEFEFLKEKLADTKKGMLVEVERKMDHLYEALNSNMKFDHELDSQFNEKVNKINQIIENHNQIVEDFNDETIRKKEIWEKSYIASKLDELIEIENNKKELKEYLERILILIERHKDRIYHLQDELSGSRVAANTLSEYLTQYLGRNDIQVKFNEQTKGFHFKRGKEKATSLSDGEKTGIALIYFLTKLGERDFDIEDCIVVVDDPVSSLDSNSLYHAFSFIKEHCKNAKQLILLTHNFELLRRINKWFKHERSSKYSRFMLKCYNNEGGRYTKIDKIDSLLVRYESEYHYLFKLLYQKNKSEDDSLDSVYNFPNITRRYLEMFFSFRAPRANNMHSKIEKSVDKGAITKEQGNVLQHFLNVGSHGDTEKSFTSFDVSHLSKSKDAINSALELVENHDTDHYEAMVDLVT